MIVWDSKLRCGNGAKKRCDKLRKKISNHKPARGIYCIALASNPSNLLDIYSAAELCFPYYKKESLHMVGLAKGRDEALQLAADIVTEIYQSTEAFDVRAYYAQ